MCSCEVHDEGYSFHALRIEVGALHPHCRASREDELQQVIRVATDVTHRC